MYEVSQSPWQYLKLLHNLREMYEAYIMSLSEHIMLQQTSKISDDVVVALKLSAVHKSSKPLHEELYNRLKKKIPNLPHPYSF